MPNVYMKCSNTAFTINNHKRTLRWLLENDNDDEEEEEEDFRGGARYMRLELTDMARRLRSV